MTGPTESRSVTCPYCGEPVDTLLDAVRAGDRYVEDCPVCCRPIEYWVTAAPDGSLDVVARGEDG